MFQNENLARMGLSRGVGQRELRQIGGQHQVGKSARKGVAGEGRGELDRPFWEVRRAG